METPKRKSKQGNLANSPLKSFTYKPKIEIADSKKRERKRERERKKEKERQ